MSQELLIILIIGMILMCVFIAVQMGWYGIKRWKSIIVAASLVLVGIFGSQIWYFVENGNFGGRSFYGVIFLAPIVFFAVSKIMQTPYGHTMDLVAPSGCLVLALVKIQCLRDGCCNGYVMYIDENRFYVRFPSQLVEMVVFLIISAILFCMARKVKFRGKIFPWFLVLYGGSRFFLDFLRDTTPSYLFGLSAGSFWSMIAFGIGLIWLFALSGKEKNCHGAA